MSPQLSPVSNGQVAVSLQLSAEPRQGLAQPSVAEGAACGKGSPHSCEEGEVHLSCSAALGWYTVPQMCA